MRVIYALLEFSLRPFRCGYLATCDVALGGAEYRFKLCNDGERVYNQVISHIYSQTRSKSLKESHQTIIQFGRIQEDSRHQSSVFDEMMTTDTAQLIRVQKPDSGR